MLLIGLGLTGIGILIAAKMTSFEGFGTINNFIVMPLYFTSAAQFPLTRAPHWLRVLARFNPVSYGVDMLRGTDRRRLDLHARARPRRARRLRRSRPGGGDLQFQQAGVN